MVDTPTLEILPCPFCGGEARALDLSAPYDVAAYCFCKSCGAESRAETTLAAAIATWNRRAPPPQDVTAAVAWRVGRKLGRTLYRGEALVGMLDTPELAAAVVEAMNAKPVRGWMGGDIGGGAGVDDADRDVDDGLTPAPQGAPVPKDLRGESADRSNGQPSADTSPPPHAGQESAAPIPAPEAASVGERKLADGWSTTLSLPFPDKWLCSFSFDLGSDGFCRGKAKWRRGADGACETHAEAMGVFTVPEAAPVPDAPPGFRVVGRSGPDVMRAPELWIRFARDGHGDPFPDPPEKEGDETRWIGGHMERWWNKGMFDILEPIATPPAEPEPPRCESWCGQPVTKFPRSFWSDVPHFEANGYVFDSERCAGRALRPSKAGTP